MNGVRMTAIERHLIAAEYLIDSTNTHVRRKKCGDVKPRALARYSKALNELRGAIQMVRNEQGARHPTLFAGTAGGNEKTEFAGRKQKTWGSNRPHGWGKDCDAV